MNKENAPIQDLLKKPVMVKTDNKPDGTKIIPDKIPGAGADSAREELEQRRNILQNMKDFDFQIKKNQEEITNIYTKVESLSKDLDDLVSLYEIVSEQMNPFVGLSKVTKKRLDALENIIKEVDGVKTRIGDLESNFEKNGATIKETIAPIKAKPETSSTPKDRLVIPPSRPTALHTTVIETLNDSELDDLLNKSLESLLMEQNIDTMINEFFINLK
jgi:archaellum component FlaC